MSVSLGDEDEDQLQSKQERCHLNLYAEVDLRLIQQKKVVSFPLHAGTATMPRQWITVRMVVNVGTRLITIYAVTEGPTRDECCKGHYA